MFTGLRRIRLLLPGASFRTINPETIRRHSSCHQIVEKPSKDNKPKQYIKKGPGLEFFLYNNAPKVKANEASSEKIDKIPYLKEDVGDGGGKRGTDERSI